MIYQYALSSPILSLSLRVALFELTLRPAVTHTYIFGAMCLLSYFRQCRYLFWRLLRAAQKCKYVCKYINSIICLLSNLSLKEENATCMCEINYIRVVTAALRANLCVGNYSIFFN
jgi:hypothetical protein